MKIFVVILAVCFVGALAELTEKQLAKLQVYRTACATETGVDEAVVDAAEDDNVWKMDDLKLRCYFFCILKKAKIMNKEGILNEEITRRRLTNLLPPDRIDRVMTGCKDLRGVDNCETAMKMSKCYADERFSLGYV